MEDRRMISILDAYYNVMYNPFNASLKLVEFYTYLEGVETNLLLSQLVVPLCTHPEISLRIENARFGRKKRSTIWTILGDRSNTYDLQERVDEFKKLTSHSLQYALLNDQIEVQQRTLSIKVRTNGHQIFKNNKKAENLAKLMSNQSVVEIFSILGVVPR
jgi:hypothetical protein